jgi:two-component system phosphate regulon response regulator PhoB
MSSRRSRLEGPARVLVLAAEPLSKLVALTLNHGVHTSRSVKNVASARTLMREWRPQLVIVDIEVERRGALELVGVRVAGRRVPTIALSIRGDLATKLAAFERGADDVVTVPFSPEELVARVLALMRRTYGEEIPFTPVIRVGGLQIDLLEQQVRADDVTLHLTTIELALLYLLASHNGETLAREAILDALWGRDYLADSNLVDRHIRNLRVKLKDNWRRPRYIRTMPGKGYRFIAG